MLKQLGSELLLLLTAAIWGLAFVAQRQGMQYLDPLFFNGIRFSLGALVVGVFALSGKHKPVRMPFPWLLGTVLFIASTLQQVGIVYTTAGSAGFITGLYVVFVPILGLFRKQRLSALIMIAVACSVTGLYLINSGQALNASFGNLLVLVSAVFWAWHVQLVDYYTARYDTFAVAFAQYALCAFASLAGGLVVNLSKDPTWLLRETTWLAVRGAVLPIVYGGIFSVGIAYTLQIHAQKRVPPAPATLILCLEGVFALIGGWLLLKEALTLPILLGAALLLAAMLLSICSPKTK